MLDRDLVVIRGGGDLASGIACRLYNSGFKVLMVETDKPSVIRRKISFAEAVYESEVLVEGICGRLAGSIDETLMLAEHKIIPVIIDPKLSKFKSRKPYILVDAILAKKNIGTSSNMATIVIGVGPGFTAGFDVDAVVESNRGHNLGKVILNGQAEPDTGIPGNIGGFTEERVIKSPEEGRVKVIKDIGCVVEKGETVAMVGGTEIKTKISGVVRGMIRDGYYVSKGMKMGDVDPRVNISYCYSISDKARSIGGGVLEAILCLSNKQNNLDNINKEVAVLR